MPGYIRSSFPNDKEFPVLDEGEYTAKVDAISEKMSKTGKSMVVFELKEVVSGQLLWLYCMNEGDNRWMLKKVIQAITGQIQPSGDVNIAIDDLLGRRIKVIVAHEMYNGKKTAKIKDVIVTEAISPGQTTIGDPGLADEELPF